MTDPAVNLELNPAPLPEDADRKSVRIGFLGRTPPFTKRQRRVFWIASTAGFFDQYDRALLSLALKQIQAGLKIAESHLGAMLSIVRLGYLLSLLMTPFADVFGRRRLLLYTIFGYTIFTALIAIAPNERTFVAFEMIARAFAGAEAAIAMVIVAEEVDAAHRGWAIGLLSAVSNVGYGLAAIVFAFINTIPYGWRGLYAIALLPLILIIPLRRSLPESARFEKEKLEGLRPVKIWEPVAQLYSAYPGRLMMMLSIAFLGSMGGNAAGFLFPKFLQEAHHWSPGQVSSLVVIGGALGIMGSIFAGRLSDRYGRRVMGCRVPVPVAADDNLDVHGAGLVGCPGLDTGNIFRHRVRHDPRCVQRGAVPDLVPLDRGQRARSRRHHRRRAWPLLRERAVQLHRIAGARGLLPDRLLDNLTGDHVVPARDFGTRARGNLARSERDLISRDCSTR